MADQREATAASNQNDTSAEVLDKAKNFWDNYSKKIIIAGSVIIALLLGWIGYNKFIKEPKELKANEAIFLAEGLFDKMAGSSFGKDSVNIVINGGTLNGESVTGLLKVINTYDGTPTANRARYMVGASYLQIKEFDKAIKYLKEFKSGGAAQIESKAYLLLGHAYAEKKQKDEAYDYYKKAAAVNEKDEVVTPEALMIVAGYAETLGKNNEAIDAYKKIKEKYPFFNAAVNGDIDKALARLGVLN